MAESLRGVEEELSKERRRVDFDTYDISVQQLTTMVGDRQIDAAPAYQRKFRWDDERQAELIESIFLGIPVPSLFMATNQNSSWEVVDGLQRISTIVRYAGSNEARQMLGINSALRITGLKKLKSLNGRGFEELPDSLQLAFRLRPVKVTTLSDKSDRKVRFDLFERLNTGGIRLTNQEIRGVIYRGKFNDFLEEMSQNESFRKVVLLKDSSEMDGTREEYVLRFFAFLDGYRTFDHSVADFLNDFMDKASKSFDYKSGRKIFEATFDQLVPLAPKGINRRKRFTPVNLFEAVAVGAAVAIQKKGKLKKSLVAKWINAEGLLQFTTAATNSNPMVVGRIEFAAKKFGGLS